MVKLNKGELYDGQWHHIAYTSTNNTFYVDGRSYGHMDNNWNWIPNNAPKKGNTMKVTSTLRNHLINGALADFNTARANRDAANKAYADAEATYRWAQNLRINDEFAAPAPAIVNNSYLYPITTRYFVPSLSGKTKGHYIEQSRDTISCTCPGFVNRQRCWATNKILSRPSEMSSYRWNKSLSLFDTNRRTALNAIY
jgi:hypothetical protein